MFVCVFLCGLQKPEEGNRSPELEVQVVINHCMGAEVWTQALCKCNKCSKAF